MIAGRDQRPLDGAMSPCSSFWRPSINVLVGSVCRIRWPRFDCGLPVAVVCSSLAVGCQRESQQPGGSSHAESAETTWNEELPDSIPVWSVADSTMLLLGETDSTVEEIFHRIASAFIDSNGNVVVANEGTSEVRVFDAGGTFKLSFGAPGGGPEEFSLLRGAWPYAADSTYTFDLGAQRIGIWTSSGELGRSFLLPQELGPRFHSVHRIAGERFLVVSNIGTMMVPAGATNSIDSSLVVTVSPTGNLVGEVTRVPYHELRTVTTPSGDIGYSGFVLAPEGQFAVRPERLDYGWPSDWTIFLFPLDGSAIDTVRFDLPIRRLTRTMFDEWTERLIERSDPGQHAALRQYYREWRLPQHLPAFDRMLVDDAGYLWLRRFRFLDEPNVDWVVISPEGTIAARTIMEGSFEPMHIGTTRIAGVRRDEMEREQVVVVTLSRNSNRVAVEHCGPRMKAYC